MGLQTKFNGRNTMAYVMARIYSDSGTIGAEELAQLALKELAPKLGEGGGLTRYVTIVFSDGRLGSFSAYESQEAAKRGQQIAAELVKGHKDFQSLKLDETMEGEVIYAAQGSVPMTGRLHGVSRVYTTNASVNDVKDAFENEAGEIIQSFPGLARYTVAKLSDGRIGVFNSFDSQENAKKSSEQARSLRAKSGSKIARTLPSDPQTLEGTVIGSHPG
jgi:hypothetical protein